MLNLFGILSTVLFFAFTLSTFTFGEKKVKEATENTKFIVYPLNGKAVDKTVAELLKTKLMPNAKIVNTSKINDIKDSEVFRISISDEKFFDGLEKFGFNVNKDQDWIFFRINSKGTGDLVASKTHLLYMAYCRLEETWSKEDIFKFEKGRMETPTFRWMEGSDGYFAGMYRIAYNYEPESTIKELARLGCSHISVNGLASIFPFEEGPPGEIYYRFYGGSPDLDQFVESDLNKGTYPPEYLQANLNFLKRNAELALKYGLTPGLNCCSPRSVPESLLEKFPFLRGARVDHTFRSYRPRYTLTLSHPVVKWHYSQLMKKIMQEVPELGYIFIWTNDSGSGFEYVTKLYPGRNGGAYLIREWVDNDAIAKAAAQNVVDYYKLLRDAASEINPGFRVISGLSWFWSEGDYILDGLGDRLDLAVSVADKTDLKKFRKIQSLPEKGSYLFENISLSSNFIIGTPFPWLAHEQLQRIKTDGFDKISAIVSPISLDPYNINREILFEYQINSSMKINEIIDNIAIQWVGSEYSKKLVEVWKYADQAIRAFPDVPLYGNSWAFPLYRHWVRPFVPNIEKIPEKEREYYEKYMIATFNNPTNIDFDVDCLWSLFSLDKIPVVEKADRIVDQCDNKVWEPLNKSINILNNTIETISKERSAYKVFIDQKDRLLAFRCYYRTLRNIAAWVGSVHGYIESKNETEKIIRLKSVQEMIGDEIQNTKDLLHLYQNSNINFVPISTLGETFFMYGENFPQLLNKKIDLMEKHKLDEPYINPNYMWRMPPGSNIDEKEYLKF